MKKREIEINEKSCLEIENCLFSVCSGSRNLQIFGCAIEKVNLFCSIKSCFSLPTNNIFHMFSSFEQLFECRKRVRMRALAANKSKKAAKKRRK